MIMEGGFDYLTPLNIMNIIIYYIDWPHGYVIRIRSTQPGDHFVMAASVTVLVMDAQDSGLVASAGTFISTLIDPVARHTPAANESRGDERLLEARKVAFEYESVIDVDGRTAIDDRIA